jgi:small conductance mechanosensitive channel
VNLSPFITIGSIVLAFALAALAVRLVRRLIQRFLSTLNEVNAGNHQAVQARAATLGRALTLLAYGIAAVISASFALSRFGLADPEWDPRLVGRWFLTHGVNLAIIMVGATVITRAASLAVEHLQFRISRRQAASDLEWQRRARTIGRILSSLVTVVVAFVAVLMALRELTIDVMPILTGAGIAGLAVGFGAQNLVRDVISGFFIILEDQVRVGDLARINAVTGTVEDIRLRTIVLRDADGAVQFFPSGGITALANLSKHYAFAVVDVRVAYSESIDRVSSTIREIGGQIQSDPLWGALVLAPIEVLGVESIDGGMATVRMRFKTLPLNQGKIGNELRRRLMAAFVARGIRPYAQ